MSQTIDPYVYRGDGQEARKKSRQEISEEREAQQRAEYYRKQAAEWARRPDSEVYRHGEDEMNYLEQL